MRRKVITTVVTFSTTTAAMKMEKTAKEVRISGKTDPDPFRDQCPVRTGMEMRGAIRGGNRKFPERKRNWPGMASIVFWHKADIVCCV